MRALLYALALLFPLLPTMALAAERNDLGSCYSQAKLDQYRPAPSGRQLVVIVDQTVQMPDDLQRSAWNHIGRFVQPGDQVKLYSFSAFVPGEYMRLLADVTLDISPSDALRSGMSMSRLRVLDRCLHQQQKKFISVVGGHFVSALREASETLPRSEIMHALREVGQNMNQQPVSERVIFLISDMLEHSDYTTFYASRRIKMLNIEQELQLAKKQGLFADLQGARVYVSGAGVVTSDVNHAYRSSKTMDRLHLFWSEYFNHSGAQLEGFGMPMLNIALR